MASFREAEAVSGDGLTPRERAERSAAVQRDQGLAKAQRIWAGPLWLYLLKNGLAAALLSLTWLGRGWIAASVVFLIIMAVSMAIRAHFIRRYGRGDDPASAT